MKKTKKGWRWKGLQSTVPVEVEEALVDDEPAVPLLDCSGCSDDDGSDDDDSDDDDGTDETD